MKIYMFLSQNRVKNNILIFGLFIGTIVRILAFKNYLPGLNQDEASSGYEAWSLWHSGFDRWSEVRWPVYFTAWGSGQNVLLSYLIAPIVGLWGMSSFTVRILHFLMTLASLPLLYVLMRNVVGVSVAIISVWMLALSPWHTMMSVWALESNLLPFFLLITILCLEKWRVFTEHMYWLIGASISASLCLYAYGLAVLVLPLLIAIYAIPYLYQIWKKKMIKQAFQAMLAIFPGIMLALPFFLFLIKNYILRGDLGFEQWLPFGLQLLPITRLDQVVGEAEEGVLSFNFSFILKAFDDGLLWNTFPGHKPFLWVSLGFVLFQLLYSLFALINRQKMNFRILAWCLASTPIFLFFPLNVNRANPLWIPLLCLSAYGAYSLFNCFIKTWQRILLLIIFIFLFFGDYAHFFYDYYTKFPTLTSDYLRYNMPSALDEVERFRTENHIAAVYVSPTAFWGYLYIIFHRQILPADFRDNRETLGYHYHADRVGDFIFSKNMLNKYDPEKYVFLFYKNEMLPCNRPIMIKVYKNWQFGICSH